LLPDFVKIGEDLVNRHHIAITSVHVKQVDSMGDRKPVKDGLLWNYGEEIVLLAVDDRSPYTIGGGPANEHTCIDTAVDK
jgi:hypothetical protein